MTEDDRLTDKDLIWHPGTGPMTSAHLAAMHTRHANAVRPIPSGTVLGHEHLMADADRGALLAELERMREARDDYRDQLAAATEEAARLERKNANLREALINAHEAGTSLGQDVERLNLEVVQVQSGAQIAMNAGVAALQEVGRLEKERDQLKEINDRMAEDRLRIVDERNRFKWMVEAARKALFEDAASSHEHRYRAIARALEREECPDEYCAGWKDSGICPQGLRHW